MGQLGKRKSRSENQNLSFSLSNLLRNQRDRTNKTIISRITLPITQKHCNIRKKKKRNPPPLLQHSFFLLSDFRSNQTAIRIRRENSQERKKGKRTHVDEEGPSSGFSQSGWKDRRPRTLMAQSRWEFCQQSLTNMVAAKATMWRTTKREMTQLSSLFRVPDLKNRTCCSSTWSSPASEWWAGCGGLISIWVCSAIDFARKCKWVFFQLCDFFQFSQSEREREREIELCAAEQESKKWSW